MAKMINRKRLEKLEQCITNTTSANVDLLLGSKSATEALMTQISSLKACMVDYSRVYDQFMEEIVECEDIEERRAMLKSAESAFTSLMGCVSEALGMGVVMGIQGSVYDGVDAVLDNRFNRDRIARAQYKLDDLMLAILKATNVSGSEGSVMRTMLKNVREKAQEAMGVYPPVFSLLGLFNRDSDISPEVAGIKEFAELRDALNEQYLLDDASIDELQRAFDEDVDIYERSQHRKLRDAFNF